MMAPARRQALLSALGRGDAHTIKAVSQDPETPERLREFLNTWLRHHRGVQVAAAAARQELQVLR